VKTASTFRPSPSVQRREIDPQNAFAARHFAARRAGFLLRELARQQEQATREPEIEEIQEAIIEPAEDFEATLAAEREAEEARRQQALSDAYQRGRDEAVAEIAVGLDQAILALDAAARALAEREARLERELIVPLAKAGVEIGAQLARQKLATSVGLNQYLESVQEALRGGDENGSLTVTAHLHPDDLALLDRGNIKPQHLRLLADPLVSAGGVMLSTTDQVIDDRFEGRLREVREAALGAAADILRLTPATPATSTEPAANVAVDGEEPVVMQSLTESVYTAPEDVVSVDAEPGDMVSRDVASVDEIPDLQIDTEIPTPLTDQDSTGLDSRPSDSDGPSDFIE
jgi:flagellar biosynthesis/type III secretory pathway protein FliH